MIAGCIWNPQDGTAQSVVLLQLWDTWCYQTVLKYDLEQKLKQSGDGVLTCKILEQPLSLIQCDDTDKIIVSVPWTWMLEHSHVIKLLVSFLAQL